MNGGTTSALARRTRAARYVLALTLVLGGAVATLLGASVCRDHVSEGSLTPVSLCGPPAATDAEVVGVIAVVLLLLAPDIGEAGVAGITLKRRVEEAKADAATARADVAALRLTVHSLSQNVDVTTVVESGSAAVLESLAKMGLLKGATSTVAPRRRTGGRDVPRWGQTLLLTAAFDGLVGLLPERWNGASIVGRVRNLAFTAGPALEGQAQRRLFDEIDVQSRAGRGEVGIMPPTATLPMVVVAPVADVRGTHLGEVVMALPTGVMADESEAIEHLKPIRAAFAAMAAYAIDNGLTSPSARPVDSPGE